MPRAVDCEEVVAMVMLNDVTTNTQTYTAMMRGMRLFFFADFVADSLQFMHYAAKHGPQRMAWVRR
jgi:hypothetical protein